MDSTGEDNTRSGSTGPQIESSSTNQTPRLPDFWEEDPELWFLQVEAVLSTFQIKSEIKKYHLIVGQLPHRALTQVADIMRNPGPDPLNNLKERLLATYAESQERKVQKLLEETTLGDLRPSQLLRQMQSLAGSAATSQVLRTIWLRAMPQRIQSILAALDQDDIDKLAKIADKILEVDSNTAIYSSGVSIDSLSKQVSELQVQLQRVTSRKATPRSRSRSRERIKKKFCYYHWKFKENARRCQPPCSWAKQNPPQKKEN